MALTIKHNKQTVIADDPAKDVSASEWNDAHGVTGTLDIANGGTGADTGSWAATALLVTPGDIRTRRTGDSGVVYLGTGDHYLYWDGGSYTLASGNLSVNGVQIGNGVSTGYYGDASNLAIRTPGSGTIYFQSQSGGSNYGNIGPGGLTVASGLTVGGTLTANGFSALNGSTTIDSNQYFGAASPSKFQVYGAGAYPTIAFHAPGYFGANFGMNTNGNFYMGGWSFGSSGEAYQFWTTRDYGNNPVYSVVNMRQVYAGDQDRFPPSYGGTDLSEPWGGTIITQTSFTVGANEDGQRFCNGSMARFRYMQFQTATGNWYTAPYA